MSTLLTLKTDVANQLGANDAATPNAIRDNAINRARRKYYSEKQWSFLFKSAAVTLTAQQGPLPADYNNNFPPISVYRYVGQVKYEYEPVPWSDLLMYDQAQFVYAVDLNANVVKLNDTSVTSITVDYTYLPADAATDGSADSNLEPATSLAALALLAIAYWWLASERATGKYQMFKQEYEAELAGDIRDDDKTKGVTFIYPRSRRIRTGYWGRV